MKSCIVFFVLVLFNSIVLAEGNIDQWQDSKKTYKDLVNEGFEVKAFNTNNIEITEDLIMILFVTVLQKDKEVYECQEYQTISLRNSLETLDISFVCRNIVQPYSIGLGT